MTSQPNLKISIFVMIVFFVGGIVCYAAFSPPDPAEPVRLMFQNKAGKVLFGHDNHIYGYGYDDCMECHHNLEDDEIYNCSECHDDIGDDYMPKRSDAFHMQCQGCHEYDGGPVDCNACHAP